MLKGAHLCDGFDEYGKVRVAYSDVDDGVLLLGLSTDDGSGRR